MSYTKNTNKTEKSSESFPFRFFKLWYDILLIISLLRDYFGGTYKTVPWNTLTSLSIAFLYLISPIDIIPDMVPIVGIFDDIIFIRIAISFCANDIKKYKIWKDSFKYR